MCKWYGKDVDEGCLAILCNAKRYSEVDMQELAVGCGSETRRVMLWNKIK